METLYRRRKETREAEEAKDAEEKPGLTSPSGVSILVGLAGGTESEIAKDPPFAKGAMDGAPVKSKFQRRVVWPPGERIEKANRHSTEISGLCRFGDLFWRALSRGLKSALPPLKWGADTSCGREYGHGALCDPPPPPKPCANGLERRPPASRQDHTSEGEGVGYFVLNVSTVLNTPSLAPLAPVDSTV